MPLGYSQEMFSRPLDLRGPKLSMKSELELRSWEQFEVVAKDMGGQGGRDMIKEKSDEREVDW